MADTKAKMSLFSGSSRARRNIRRKVVHSVSDSENEADKPSEEMVTEQQTADVQPAKSKVTDTVAALSFMGQEAEEDFTEIKLKKRERVHAQRKLKQEQKKKLQDTVEYVTPAIPPSNNKEEPLEMLTQGRIPSAAAIHAARKKREMARSFGNDVGANYIGVKNVKPTNIISDDENSDGAEESKTVRQFGVAKDTSKQIEVLSAIDNAASGSDEERFMEEQMYKGVSSFPAAATTAADTAADGVDVQEYTEDLLHKPAHPAGGAVFNPTVTAISVESLQSQLSTQLEHLKDQMSRNNDAIHKLEGDMECAEKEIAEMDLHSHTLAMRYQFFQEIKGYIRDLLYCLTEKVPEIKRLEEAAFEIEKNRSDIIMARRRQDLLDTIEECTLATSDPARQARVVEREGRRRRRREARQKAQRNVGHYEGMSSDDELLKSVENKLLSETDAVTSEKEKIFSDVLEDFSKIFPVIMHFREWKYNFPTSYEQAYLSLCLPKLLKPYVQLQLITWNPLKSSPAGVSLEGMSWVQDLLFFAYQGETQEVDSSDSDLLLLPRVVETVVIPKLTDFISQVWDPLSATQSSSLVGFVRQLVKDFPTVAPDGQSYQSMLKAVFQRNQGAMEKDIIAPTFSTETVNNPASLQYQYCQRQFWTSFKLLGNVMKWQGILPDSTLQELVVDGLLNRYILISLQSCPTTELSIAKVKKILSLLPSSWWTDHCSTNLPMSGLYSYVKNVVEVLERSVLSEPETKRQALRSTINEGLALLNEVD